MIEVNWSIRFEQNIENLTRRNLSLNRKNLAKEGLPTFKLRWTAHTYPSLPFWHSCLPSVPTQLEVVTKIKHQILRKVSTLASCQFDWWRVYEWEVCKHVLVTSCGDNFAFIFICPFSCCESGGYQAIRTPGKMTVWLRASELTCKCKVTGVLTEWISIYNTSTSASYSVCAYALWMLAGAVQPA
jgi:hypothetical protein